MNKRNLKHGFSGSPTYHCWQNLKRSRGGVCLSWRNVHNFVADMGLRPSPAYWLFRAKSYQRSCSSNVAWRLYKRQFRDIWQYLTPEEISTCHRHIVLMCTRGGYSLDAGLNELYLQDLAGVEDPLARIHSWIKQYLPKTLSVLKKKRNEVQYIDEVKYGH